MSFHGGSVVVAGNGGSGIKVDGTSSFSADTVYSAGNGGHGLDMDEGADVSVTAGMFSGNGGDGIHQRASVLVVHARALGVGDGLADDELFKALQAIHLATQAERPNVLKASALWASFAKLGLDVAGGLASVYSVFHAAGLM